ncbi:MAG: Gfo/Idh/MocA family oxidoreductase [Phycisphaerae bacterium]|nr:Gfo/Idh/MocA family oxidoreductase [Phycisphaerae bacterium]
MEVKGKFKDGNKMSEGKLKTAVLGLNEQGLLLLEAASELGHFEIVAVADKDGGLAEKVADRYQCASYDDYRQLISVMDSGLRSEDEKRVNDRKSSEDRENVEEGEAGNNHKNRSNVGCLLVAAAMHTCDEYVRMAAKKKINILKLAPVARNFEEAAELVHLAEIEDIQIAVGNPCRFARSYLELRDIAREGNIKHVFLIRAFCGSGQKKHPAWQTDPKLAGGGVLLHNCYQMIDEIILNFGTPEQVYSLNTSAAGDRQQRLYLTEDTSVVTMKFSDTMSGNLIASRRSETGPEEEFLKIYGKDKILTVTNKQLVTRDVISGKSKKLNFDDESGRYRAMLENFALSILQPANNKLCSSGRENLTNMAVIDSAYLSARTGMPEEPGKLLQMAQIEPTEI